MLFHRLAFAGSLLLTVSLGVSVEARADLLTNGDFSAHSAGFGQLTVGGYAVTGWTGGGKEGNFGSPTTPPVFLFSGGTATDPSGLASGVNGDGFMGTVRFFGGAALTPPVNTPVIAADGDPDWGGSIQQTVNGLTIGQVYTLTFNWAGAQQQGFSGNTTEFWQVDFGSSTQNTATVSTPSQTFVGWQSGSMNFTAGSASQVLRFLAKGSPSGQPPWLLLNNVSLNPVVGAAPEPGALALVGPGLMLVGGLAIRKRRRAAR